MVSPVSSIDLSWYDEFLARESTRTSERINPEVPDAKRKTGELYQLENGSINEMEKLRSAVWEKIQFVLVQMTEYHVLFDRYQEELALNKALEKTWKAVSDEPVEEDEMEEEDASIDDYIITLQLGHERLQTDYKAFEDEIAAIKDELAESRKKEESHEAHLSQLTVEINALSGRDECVSIAPRWVSSVTSLMRKPKASYSAETDDSEGSSNPLKRFCKTICENGTDDCSRVEVAATRVGPFHRAMRRCSNEKEKYSDSESQDVVIAGRPRQRPWKNWIFREKRRCSASGTSVNTSLRSLGCDDFEVAPDSSFSRPVVGNIQAN